MKKIKIIQFTEPNFTSILIKQRAYHVFLWNGKTTYFQNKKDCLKYLADANEFLNEKLFEVNLMLNNCYQQYRNLWFYMSVNDCRKINSIFTSVDEMLQFAVNRAHYINGNSYAGTYLINSIKELQIVLKLISEQSKKSLMYANVNYCIAINSSLDKMLNQLNDFSGYCTINL